MGTYILTDGDDIIGVDPFRYPSDDPGPYLVRGLRGNDGITGGNLNDTLYGDEGNDSLFGGGGANLVYGGIGDDYIQFYNEAGNGPNLDLLGDQGFGEDGNDFIQYILGGASVAHAGDGGAGLDALRVSFESRIDFATQLELIYNRTIDLTNVWTGGTGTIDTGTIVNIERITAIEGGNGADTIILGNYVAPINPSSGLPFDAPLLNGLGGSDFISGGASRDQIDGGSGNDTIYGNAGDDFISGGNVFGNSGDDTIFGGTGDDIISGENGLDRLSGDEGADRLNGNAGNDILDGGADNDFLGGDEGDDIIRGGTGNDNIQGGSGLNTLFGDDGGDSVFGGADADTSFGGAGDDFMFGAAANDYQYGDDGDDTIQGGNGADTSFGGAGNDTLDEVVQDDGSNDILFGGDGNDILRGGGGNDVLAGGANDDQIFGGAGSNELYGGAGNDSFNDVSAADTIVELAGGGIDTITTSAANYMIAANVENLTYTGGGSFAATGNGGDNVITGGAAGDSLSGGAGNDTLVGGAGTANELAGGTGNDIYVVAAQGDSIIELASEGTDTVQTGLVAMVLAANVENLTFTSTGAHFGSGNALANALSLGVGTGGALAGLGGNDTLTSGTGGGAELIGGTGDDVYVVTTRTDAIVEATGEGMDEVRTTSDVYVLGANIENLVYTGAASFAGVGTADANSMTGGSGADTLIGLDGADILTGGSGADLLIGGNGADQFRYVGGESGYDRITDFLSGTDKIALASAGFAQTSTVAFVSGAGAVANSTNSTFLYDTSTGIVSYDADGTGAGAAVQLAQLNTGLTLTVSDFVFI